MLLDVNIQGEGNLAICRHCGEQVARVVGFVPPDLSQHLYEQLTEARATIETQRIKINDLNELVGKQNDLIAKG